MYSSTDSFDEDPTILARVLVGLAGLLLLPISILNFVALPAGAIWLCVLGYWKLVVLSLIAAFICPKIIGLLTLPSHGLQVAAAKMIGQEMSSIRWFACVLLLAGSYYYLAFAFGAWSLTSFSLIIRSASANATIPALLVAFAVGIWPEQAMADRANRSIQENLCLLCGITELLAMSILVLFRVGDLRWYLTACVISIMVFVPIQVWIAMIGLRETEG
jgi:hypothetical protein